METNKKEFPWLRGIWDRASKSYKFIRDIDNLEEAPVLIRMMVDTTGEYFTEDRVDCLMTTMCTNMTLPEILDNYGRDEGDADDELYDARYGWDRFRRLFDYVSRRFMFPLVHYNALYSRLGVGTLWGEISDQIESEVAATAMTAIGDTKTTTLMNTTT